MGNILGEPFKKYVQEQIIQRQEIHGKINRSEDDITYLNSKNAWVKLGSGVFIDEKRMKMLEGNPMAQDVPLGSTLAQNNVLFNGLANPIEGLEGLNKYSKTPRAGVGTDILDIGSSTNNQAYGVGGFGGINGNFGFSPMPGIIDADLKTLNRGSIKKATINIKCFNKYQFDIIDVLYLRLGYSIFLEFGSSIYYNPDKELTTLDQSLMSEEYFFSSDYDKSDYSVWLPIIEERRKASGGNYDGMFGVVSNFSWTFGEDGSYSIKLEIISHGDVIESLKVNLPPLNKTGLTPQQQLQQQKKAKEAVKKANESGIVDYDQTQFYTDLYPGLEKTLRDWYDTGLNDSQSNGLVYEMNTDWYNLLGSNFEKIFIRQESLPTYTRGAKDISETLTNERLQKEINTVMGKALTLSVKYSFEGANWSLNQSKLPLNYGDIIIAAVTGQGPAADAAEAFLMFGFQKVIKPGESDPGKAFPVLGLTNRNELGPKTTRPETFFKSGFNGEAIDRFNYIYKNNFKDEISRQKLLLSYIGFDNLLTAFYLVLYTMYLKPNFMESPDDVSFGDSDASAYEGDSSTEPSQMALDQEQKGKNRIREYLYNLRYFDTISGGDLQNQSQIRQKFEETKANAFKYNIKEKRESKNELDLSQIKPESLDNIVRITVVNPNFNQTKSVTAADASYGKNDKWFWEDGEDDMLKNAQQAVRNEQELTKAQITKNIEEWNKAKLFPPLINPDGVLDGEKIEIITLNINEPKYSYFIRLGTFLDFLQEKVIPKIETGNKKGQPLITIDTNPEKNICYVEQNTISFDPRKLIISNKNFSYSENDLESNPPIYESLNSFQVAEKGYRYGKVMNVYFNFNRIQEIFDDVDVKNNINLFEVVKTLCNDINECLGGLNNLEPVITDETPVTDPENPRYSYVNSNDYSGNTITIIDQTSIPGIEQIAPELGLPNFVDEIYTLDIYGNRIVKDREDPDNPDINSSPFVKNVGLTTQIDKNYATMITIGATANGEIPGENSTAFSKWNIGVKDRFKNNVIDAVAETGSLESQNTTVVEDYKTMTSIGNYLGLLGYNADLTINEDFISTQISTHANYFAYEQALKTQDEIKKNLSGLGPGSMGFIPFNLKLTLDGISGIKIYNKIKVDTRFLPSNYPSTLKFLVTGIDHSLKDNMWETQLSTVATSAGVGANESGEEEYVEAVPYTDEELAEQRANDEEVNTQSIVDNNTKGNQTGQSSKAEKEIKKENVQKKNNTKPPKITPPSNYPKTAEEAKTLGTSAGPIINPNAYKSTTELELAIKKGMEIINNIPNNIQNKHSLLRTRILQVAASYVGQTEITNNKGWVDPVMEERYKSLAWGPKLQWCNFSVWLWWYEAFTVGNDYVQSTLKYPNNFDKPKRHPMHPVDILLANSKFGYYDAPASPNPPKGQYAGSGKSRGFVAQGTENSNKNFKRIERWVDIDKDPSKLKTAIKNNKILPGDAIYFNTKKNRYVNHIGIYLCPGDINCNSIWTIEGNTDPDSGKQGGVWKKYKNSKKLKTIQGIGQLFTNQELITYG
jgi:hypothetical protein